MDSSQTVFDFIKSEENAYRTTPIQVTDNWDWNMYDHVNLTVLYKNSTYKTGKNDDKPFKNITRPILNLQYRSEGFDVKDIKLFIDDPDEYYKSFLVRKYHDKWARENDIDTFVDELVESYVDFGGVLIKDVNKKRPEWVPFQRLSFCDQTDILSGPICEKHYYSPDQLRDMAKQGWKNIDELIKASQTEKSNTTMANGRKVKTPGKYIEVYELHGTFPAWWLNDSEDDEAGESQSDEDTEDEYISQLQIVAFYKNTDTGQKTGITLFSGKETESPYKFLARDKIYGRALGLGGAEELFEAQVWTNYDIIRVKNMLDAAAKIIYQTTDASIAARNKVKNMDNEEILITAPNTRVDQINTMPVNITLFERSIEQWNEHAKEMGSSGNAIEGDAPRSGVAFDTQRLAMQQASAIHDYRQGKLAIFVGELYRDWILPYFSKEIAKGKQFLSELSLDELQQVADNLVTNQANDMIKEKILNGESIDPQQVDQFKQQVKTQFMKGGNKRFLKILEGEMKDIPMDIEVSIGDKQKDLTHVVDQLTRIFQQVIAAPQILNDPRMAKIFNMILEAAGMSPLDFYMPPQPEQDKPANQVSESISFKDLPPDGQVQMAAQAGLKIAPPQPQIQQPAMVGAGNLNQ